MQENLPLSTESGRFEFQKWPVYTKAVEFCRDANRLCLGLPKEVTRAICDQLRRASHSIVLNIAEGSSRFSKNDKVSFLRIARGSVFECVSILDLLCAMEHIEKEKQQKLESDLAELGRMLSGFIRHVDAHNPNVTGNLARKG